MTRPVRILIVRGAFLAVLMAWVQFARVEADEKFEKKTLVYKKVGETEIQADVFYPAAGKIRPVVVWLHGGALILGSRAQVPGQILEHCRKQGYILVSLDYRLAPEVKLADIVADLQDAFRWIREQGPELFHADPAKIVVTGGSAGGFLTMLTGFAVEPRPSALVAFWGYGDFEGPEFSGPSAFYLKQPPIAKEKALAGLSKSVLTGTDAMTQAARVPLYHSLRQQGRWAAEVTGVDTSREPWKLDQFSPVKNVTSAYPPLLMIHGTADEDVPYEKSESMAKELARHKVPHELITIPGAGHGLSGGDRKLIADANARALEFISEHLRK